MHAQKRSESVTHQQSMTRNNQLTSGLGASKAQQNGVTSVLIPL